MAHQTMEQPLCYFIRKVTALERIVVTVYLRSLSQKLASSENQTLSRKFVFLQVGS